MLNIEKEALVKLLGLGYSKQCIADEFNCSKATIINHLKKHGLYKDSRQERKETKSKRPIVSGNKYHNWTAIEREAESRNNQKYYWLCVCDCGTKKYIAESSLKRGLSRSCGCASIKKYEHHYKDISPSYFRRLKQTAEQRNIEFNITQKDIWSQYIKQGGKCFYSGIEIIFHKDSNKSYKCSASIDRVNPYGHYTPDNIVIVHKRVNYMKSDLLPHELLWWAEQIVNRKACLPEIPTDYSVMRKTKKRKMDDANNPQRISARLV